MTVRTVCRIATVVGFSVAVSAFAPPPKSTPVTSIVLDYAADVAPALQVLSDGGGSYLNAKTLVSQIQTGGAWELDARVRNATRMIYLDFSQAIPGSAPGGADPVSLPSGLYKFRILANCNLFSLAAGATSLCDFRVGFDYNGTRYAFVMNPGFSPNGPFPQTNYAQVACIFPTTGSAPCSQWRFTPSGTYTAPDTTTKYRNVAVLLEYAPNGDLAAVHGDFHLSFSMLAVK